MTCPAATLLDGPPVSGPSAICGVMANDQQRQGSAPEGETAGVLVTSGNDPSSYWVFCTGLYQRCPVWRSEKQRIEREGVRLRADVG